MADQSAVWTAYYRAAERYRLVRVSHAPRSAWTDELVAQCRNDYVTAFVAAVNAGAINGGAEGLLALLAGCE